jgi:hypothetical protein
VLEKKLKCSCNQPFDKCALWSKILDCYPAKDRKITLYHLQQTFLNNEGWKGLFNSILGATKTNQLSEYQTKVSIFYSRIFSVLSNKYIVDSSKTARGASGRPAVLNKICGLKIKLVHLTRDPRGVYYSVCKGSNERMELGKATNNVFKGIKAVIGWATSNLACLLNSFVLGRDNYLHLRYENLIINPQRELIRLGNFLNLDMTPVINKIQNDGIFMPGHIIGGNRMSRSGTIRFKPDLSWQHNMPFWKKSLVWLAAWPMVMFFGYGLYTDRW